MPELPTLGVGITYARVLEPLFEEAPELFDVLEVEPQTVWLQSQISVATYWVPEATLRHLAGLPGKKLIHSVGTPVGGAVRPEAAQLALLRKMVDSLSSPWASDHLSFNSTPEFKTGFFLPPRQTEQAIDTIVRNVHDLQQALGVPIAVETGVNYLRPRSDEIPDGSFTAMVAERADCGILLDLHNIFANELNGRQTMLDFLAQLPLERVWEVHLAGGMEIDDYWLDAHSGAIAEPLFEIAKKIIPTLPNLRAIIFEIFPAYVESVGLGVVRAQIEHLHELWDKRQQANTQATAAASVHVLPPAPPDRVTSLEWESTLGALVVGQVPTSALGDQLAADPGVNLISRLVNEFRGSMIVSVLPLTSRMIMLSLGIDTFRLILSEFWREQPPRLFASSEALAFADFLQRQELAYAKLMKILEYECAVVETLLDDQTRIVSFDFDPFPLIRALAQRRLPDVAGAVGAFEIEITGESLDNTASSKVVGGIFPFH